ncbi:MAG: type II toxin-antitoxin system HicA family toxin [Bacteroidota bacterium]
MSKIEKLILKLLSHKSSFTYNELRTLLTKLGYEEKRLGKTSGSRVAYVHSNTKHIIRLHKPHPGNELKRYQIKYLVDELKKQGYIS